MPVKTTTHTHTKNETRMKAGSLIFLFVSNRIKLPPISQLLSPPHTHTLTQTKYNVETPNLPVRNLQTSGTHNNK